MLRASVLVPVVTLFLFPSGMLRAQVAELGKLEGQVSSRELGASVAIEGDRALVGDTHDAEQGPGAGAVHVLERDGSGAWTASARLLADDGEEGYYLGTAVAFAGRQALLGASGDDDLGYSTGAVYVFETDAAGTWHQVDKLGSGRAGQAFGFALDVSGDRALIGAPWGVWEPGTAYVFERDASGVWSLAAELQTEDGAPGIGFGAAVALDGDRALIGAEGHDSFSGAAFVFERASSGEWIEVAELHSSDGLLLGRFGVSVALDGDRALIGANQAVEPGSGPGAAYVFERDAAGVWTETARLEAADARLNDRFGSSVALSGERALIGAPRDDHGQPFGPGHNAGSMYVFRRGSGGQWTQTQQIRASDAGFEKRLGHAVALAGERAVGGAISLQGPGEAYVFDLEPLSSAVREISLSRGGVQPLAIDAGQPHAEELYLVLGSMSGTEPGIPLPGGSVLPLNRDAYFAFTLSERGSDKPPLLDSFGRLDENGSASGAFVVPPGSALSLSGRTLHHAALTFAPGRGPSFVTNALSVTLVP